jgi:hypothetical protein
VSGQTLYATPPNSTAKATIETFKSEDGWTPEAVWTSGKIKKSITPAGNTTPLHPATHHTEIFRLLLI